MAGGDQLHIGTAGIGKMESSEEDVLGCERILKSRMGHLKTVFPVASGGIYPSLVPAIVKAMGRDVVINAGGGIWGHPNGGRAGATAMRDAIESAVKAIPLKKYAKAHPSLAAAIKEWD